MTKKVITTLGCYVWPSAKYELRKLLNHTFTTDHDYLLTILQQMVDVSDVLYTMKYT